MNDEKLILAANDVEFPIKGKGDIVINFCFQDYTLKNILFSRNLRCNLTSGLMLDQHKLIFVGKNGSVKDILINIVYLKVFITYIQI